MSRKAYEIEETLTFKHSMVLIGVSQNFIGETAKVNGWHIKPIGIFDAE